MANDPFGAGGTISTSSGTLTIHRLDALQSLADVSRLPHTVKILLENLLRRVGTRDVSAHDVEALAKWPEPRSEARLAFMPARVLMQDFTGVPAVVDIAAMRSAIVRSGGDALSVKPFVPVDLVIDHSVQVDRFGTADSYRINIDWEYERNAERYALLRWAQQAFEGFSVVPPGMGICHQVNLEHLSRIVAVRDGTAIPDTVVGTDSHTPMVNGVGVLAWGVGGIEAEAAILGQPMFLTDPTVVGIRTTGALPVGTTATDLVLTLTQMLREHGVVGKFVEFFGDGLSTMSVPDRATLSNMSPEFGATASLFPVDAQTLKYLKETARGDLIDLVERYTKEQGLFRTDGDPDPIFTEVLELDLSTIEPSLAGPRRPQDRVSLSDTRASFVNAFSDRLASRNGEGLTDGAVVISAITSCTNTSNPSVMIAAGLLAKKAVEAGLQTKPWVKTSLAPGSRVVTRYLEDAGLMSYLEKLGFNLVGYGCTTCIGNSGPLPEDIAELVAEKDLTVVSVLSGNRNFEGRIHPQVRAAYLASPPLCVAFALAGTIETDLTNDPLGMVDGKPVFLKDIWPTAEEITAALLGATGPQHFEEEYSRIYAGDENWKSMDSPEGVVFEWDPNSTYIQEPPFFEGATKDFEPPSDIIGARVLVKVGDSITTDHISPAGSIKADSPAGRYLQEIGVEIRDFNSFGSRRGNHNVMMRGTFGNIRLRNELAGGKEGSWTVHLPSGEEMSIYDAAMRYRDEQVPLLVLAGKEYGSGSSRDWAAKGTTLLGIKAVIAESFERIHRSNLVGMGVLPLQLTGQDTMESLGLTGRETFDIRGISQGVKPQQTLTVQFEGDRGSGSFEALVRIDAQAEVEYYLNGGILQMVLRQLL